MSGATARVRVWRRKRVFDATAAGAGLVILGPVLAGLAMWVWLADRASPVYRSERAGLGGRPFTMLKLRTMVPDADKMGGSSTSTLDPRLTHVGRVLRSTKADELLQLVNVLRGDMGLVGPRPNVMWAVSTYSEEERVMLTVPPGMTDIASVVFADEGEILAPFDDADLAYEQLIRPVKGHLSILYVKNSSICLDLSIIGLTVLNSVNREFALRWMSRLVAALGAPQDLVEIAGRQRELTPSAPPGFADVISQVGETPWDNVVESKPESPGRAPQGSADTGRIAKLGREA